jgi:hypothetical protein
MLRLLKGLDLSWQKARPVHPEAQGCSVLGMSGL